MSGGVRGGARRPTPPLAHVAGVLLLLAGCTSGSPADGEPSIAPPPPAAAAAAPTVADAAHAPAAVLSEDEVERLKALGYVDVFDEPTAGEPSGVVLRDPARSQPGYNLFTNAFTCSTEIIDAEGRVVHRWSRRPCFRWDNTTLLEDGDLLVVGREGAADPAEGRTRWNQGHYLARLGWDGSERWKADINAHHDAQLTPDGRISVLIGADRRIPEIDPDGDVSVDALAILSADGEVVEEAPLYEMLRDAPGFDVKKPRRKGPASPDLIHANSIDWMDSPALAARDPLYALGNVLVSMRHQDAIAIIDWKKRKLIWHWGRGELSGPHDAQVLPSGNILVFDNGVSRKWSRVLEVDPIERRVVWEWKAAEPTAFFTLARGSSQRLANGNTLIAESDRGRAFEVDPAGERVWEFLNPNQHEGKRVAIVRMRRLDGAFVDRLLARAAPPADASASARSTAKTRLAR